MSKRLSKEELESDPLIENFNRLNAFYNENKTTVIATLVAFVVIVGGFFGWQAYSSSQETQAQEYLAIAENYYTNAEYENALYGDDAALTYGFDQIADEFPMTKAGNMANYYAAVSSFELGDVETALTYIEEFEIPEGILGVGPLTFHGKLLLANGSYEAAAQKFLEAAEWSENNVTTPSNLFEASQAYYEAGNFEKAGQLADQIIEEYPESSQFVKAQKMKGMLAAN
ncbi:tetratricopeptide repeat protein [Gracilimonas tropica]|uniref:tetratricopeptide repeat protein n=1 Tax=Gracilimonas tropica TaxID=454600 RepID=UPI0003734BF1|nr:tetratricopeptide repeat protein [Gracilimonas tropica]